MMKRQKLRKGIIIVSFLLFPLTLYYFSPALVIQGAVEGIVVGSLIMFMLMALSAIVFGRAWCGWLCPAGGLQEVCQMVNNKGAVGGKYDLIKYAIWAPWIGLIAYFFIKAGGIHSINPFYETAGGISVSDIGSYIVYYAVVLSIVLMSLVWGRRAFCHYLCWMAPFMVIGAWLGKIFKIPALCLKVSNQHCIQCKKCTTACPMNLRVHEMVKDNSFASSECILCGSCADHCAKQVIRFGIR